MIHGRSFPCIEILRLLQIIRQKTLKIHNQFQVENVVQLKAKRRTLNVLFVLCSCMTSPYLRRTSSLVLDKGTLHFKSHIQAMVRFYRLTTKNCAIRFKRLIKINKQTIMSKYAWKIQDEVLTKTELNFVQIGIYFESIRQKFSQVTRGMLQKNSCLVLTGN